MADPNEPKKEDVPIAVPPQPVAKAPGADPRSRETVRIQLPPRQPSNKVPPSFPTEPSDPSKPSAAPSPPPPPVSAAPDLTSLGPKKETARIALMPEPPAKPAPAVQMKKTQPLIAMPPITPQSASIAVAPTGKAKGSAMMDAIPMPTCWTLLGVSAVILIIQIWIYFS
jgi:hypothetical protein